MTSSITSPGSGPRSRGGEPGARVAAADRLLLGALWILPAWLLLLHFDKVPLIPSEENSWVAVLTYATAEHWQYGKDIIFTYGPLEPLLFGTYSGKIYTALFITELVFKAGLVGLMFWLSQRLPFARRIVFLLTILFVGILSWQAVDQLAIAGAGLVLCGESRADRWAGVPAIALVALLGLVKATFLFYALLMLAVVGCYLLWRYGWPRALATAGLFGLFFVSGWLLLGQHLANLPAYLHGSWEITRGFTQAMSLPPQTRVLVLGLVAACVIVVQLLLLLWRGRAEWQANLPMFLVLSGGMVVAWKLGFARADDHVLFWLLYAIVAFVATPLFFTSGDALGGLTYWAGVPVMFCVCLVPVHWQNPQRIGKIIALIPAILQRNFYGVFHPRDDAVMARKSVMEFRQAYALPRLRNLVGSQSVDVFGVDEAIAILNGLHYAPRPSFEGYGTYTPYLVRLNTDYYRSALAPLYVIYKEQPIDGRLATLEDAPLQLALARNYEPVLADEGYVLFKRRGAPADLVDPATFPLVASGEITSDQALPLPPDAPLWCELEMHETPLGKLMNFLYQEPPVSLELTYRQGPPALRRLIPEMAASGFLINPVPESAHDFLLFAAGQPLEPIQSIRIVGDPGWQKLFERRIAYRFYRVPPARATVQKSALAIVHDLDTYADAFPSAPKMVKSTTGVERILVDDHPFLLVHVTGEMDFDIPPQAREVRGRFAIRPGAWQEGGRTDGVDFRIDYAPANGMPTTTVFDRFLNPRSAPERDGPVQSFEVTLPPDAAGELIFRTLPGPTGSGAWGWACWADIAFGP